MAVVCVMIAAPEVTAAVVAGNAFADAKLACISLQAGKQCSLIDGSDTRALDMHYSHGEGESAALLV